MKTDKLKALYLKYDLTKDDVFKHQHYIIITRSGIDKIQGVAGIKIKYEVVKCDPNFAAIKGVSFKDGNTNSWYVMEMAEKRAMSRIVLKTCGFYELGVFGEDESEDFKKK